MIPKNEDIIAMKTARPSARKPKLKPRGRVMSKENGFPLTAAGKAAIANIKGTDTKINARILLR
jgi:hypothetical protein